MAYLPQQVGQDPITKALGYLSRQIDQLKKFTFNTNDAGSDEGEGCYKKLRSKESISMISDYCITIKN